MYIDGISTCEVLERLVQSNYHYQHTILWNTVMFLFQVRIYLCEYATSKLLPPDFDSLLLFLSLKFHMPTPRGARSLAKFEEYILIVISQL